MILSVLSVNKLVKSKARIRITTSFKSGRNKLAGNSVTGIVSGFAKVVRIMNKNIFVFKVP